MKPSVLLLFCIRFFKKMLRVLIAMEKRVAKSAYHGLQDRAGIIRSTLKHNMVFSADEQYYQEQYWHWILTYLDGNNLPSDGTYLDLGCGQGRLSMPLAKWCAKGKVVGVDFSSRAIDQAEEYALKFGLSNIEYHAHEMLAFLRSKNSNSFDGAMFIEVVFFMPEYRSILQEIQRVLKPKGLLFASFRPQYFYALHSVNNRAFDDVDAVLHNRVGGLGGQNTHFTWQTSGDIKHLMENELQFELLDMYGIGCCSGLKGDPHEDIARPSLLSNDERKKLMEVEIAMARSVPDAGRYILSVALKKDVR